MIRYVLDTDIGDDIDDAFALDYALKKNVPLLGVTTVFKNTDDRARIAKKMLELYGKSLPVNAGLHKIGSRFGYNVDWDEYEKSGNIVVANDIVLSFSAMSDIHQQKGKTQYKDKLVKALRYA